MRSETDPSEVQEGILEDVKPKIRDGQVKKDKKEHGQRERGKKDIIRRGRSMRRGKR